MRVSSDPSSATGDRSISAILGSSAIEGAPGTSVVVTGAAGPLGRRVCTRLAANPSITDLVALDRRATPAGDRPIDLLADDLKELFEGASVLVHLASVFGPAREDDPEVLAAADVTMARRVLDAAGATGVPHVVILSSATVYGAWPNNPVPLSEDAPLRPDPQMAYAVQKAEVERIANEWRDAHPGVTVAILRPAPAVAGDHPGWLFRALRAAGSVRALDDDPPAQFLHLDDLATAIDLACRTHADGVFNVAPDGWLTPTEYRELAGGAAKVQAPRWLADKLATARWRLRLAPSSPGARAYTRGSFVVANDKLRALGWEPAEGNAEAYVDAVPPGPVAALSPRRRQELALGAAGVTAIAIVAAVVALLRRRRRRT